MIRTAFKVLVFSTALLSFEAMAQDSSWATAGAPGCGDDSIKFDVKTAKGQRQVQPEAGKALVYFIEDDSNFNSIIKPTTRAGVDGKWVGATHGNSYHYFYVDPGVHHLCASWQSNVGLAKDRKTAAAHFTAEAGGIYYFCAKNTDFRTDSSETIDMSLTTLDSDEGQLLVNKFKLSTSKQKK